MSGYGEKYLNGELAVIKPDEMWETNAPSTYPPYSKVYHVKISLRSDLLMLLYIEVFFSYGHLVFMCRLCIIAELGAKSTGRGSKSRSFSCGFNFSLWDVVGGLALCLVYPFVKSFVFVDVVNVSLAVASLKDVGIF